MSADKADLEEAGNGVRKTSTRDRATISTNLQAIVTERLG